MRLLFLIITILFSAVCFGQVQRTDNKAPEPGYYFEYNDSVGKMKKSTYDSLMRLGLIGDPPERKVDSLDLKVISMRELAAYLERINLAAQGQFNLTEVKKYEQILRTIQSVYSEADRKRRKK